MKSTLACVNSPSKYCIKIQSRHDSVHRRMDKRTDGQGETSIPRFQLRCSRGYNMWVLVIQNFNHLSNEDKWCKMQLHIHVFLTKQKHHVKGWNLPHDCLPALFPISLSQRTNIGVQWIYFVQKIVAINVYMKTIWTHQTNFLQNTHNKQPISHTRVRDQRGKFAHGMESDIFVFYCGEYWVIKHKYFMINLFHSWCWILPWWRCA